MTSLMAKEWVMDSGKVVSVLLVDVYKYFFDIKIACSAFFIKITTIYT